VWFDCTDLEMKKIDKPVGSEKSKVKKLEQLQRAKHKLPKQK
jgi:hypothetical protein